MASPSSTTATKSKVFTSNISNYNDFGYVMQANNIYNRSDIQWYSKFNRFGCLDPYNALTTTREYLFFTKPDLHLCEPGTNTLNPELSSIPYFQDLQKRYPNVIDQLQLSISSKKTSGHNVFMPLLSNAVKNTLDLPAINSEVMDSATNIYGSTINYRADGYKEDENVSFTLEFEDSKYLEIYQLLKCYEEYERLKRQGLVTPPNVGHAAVSKNSGLAYTKYHDKRELHDQFGIYKFIVGDDYETIIYWAYIYGVYFKNVPRDSFSDMKTDGGLRYTVDFGGWLVDDMNPQILTNFNYIIKNNMKVSSKTLPIYNSKIDAVDGRWASCPLVYRRLKSEVKYARAWNNPDGMQYDYLLKWRI